MKALIHLVVIALCSVAFKKSCGQSNGQGVDLTLMSGANGSDVVRAVLSKISASGAFSDEIPTSATLTNVFMRRMAYVESKDGLMDPYPAGGIWNVSEIRFRNTQTTYINRVPGINTVYEKIMSYFNFTWTLSTDVQYDNLTKPLYSGLAVRLEMYYNDMYSNQVITAGQLQSEYWIEHILNVSLTSEKGMSLQNRWQKVVAELETNEKCRIQADVVFVLDTSGSIMAENFEKMINYTYDFTNELIQDSDNGSRIGVILFSNNATVKIDLESTLTKSELLEAIRNISFLDGPSTNTLGGLKRLIEQKWRSELILRLGIIMTDGQCIHNLPMGQMDVCHEDTLRAAAERAINKSILTFAIGVGDEADTDELRLIAFGPEYVDHIDSFSDEVLEENREARSYEICFTTAQPINVTVPSNGSLSEEQTARFYLYTQEDDLTIRICITGGKIVFYVSTVPNPNSAYYNRTGNVTAIKQSVNCLAEFFSLDGNKRRRRQTNNEAPLYITIRGIETSNEFTFNSSFGDVTSIWDKCTTQEPPPCPEHAECYNTEESFLCRCSPGFRESTDGIKCEDVNECEEDRTACDENETCQNTIGSFDCTCSPGFKHMQNGTTCEEIGGQVALIAALTVGSAVILLATTIAVTSILVCYSKMSKHSKKTDDDSDQNSVIGNADDEENDWDYTMTITWQEQEK